MTKRTDKRGAAGFTLLEVLVILLVAGLLMAAGGLFLSRQVRDARSTDFVEGLAQDINLARSVAMARGQETQIEFVSASGYVVKNVGAPGQPVLASRTNPAVTLSSVGVGDRLVCRPSGFCLGYNSAGTSKTIAQVICTSGGKVRTLSITVLGLTRVES